MYNPMGKDYFKKTGVAMGCVYAALAILLVYCITVIVLPNFAVWCWNSINNTIDFFSKDNPSWALFLKGFFWSFTGVLCVTGIILKSIDYISLSKQGYIEDEESDLI